MIDSNTIINDPNFVPLAAEGGVVLCTEDGTFIIVSSSLPSRFPNTAYGKSRTWLKTYPRYIKGNK
jgi:hypothetical protein